MGGGFGNISSPYHERMERRRVADGYRRRRYHREECRRVGRPTPFYRASTFRAAGGRRPVQTTIAAADDRRTFRAWLGC